VTGGVDSLVAREVRAGLERAVERLSSRRFPSPPVSGKLLRPMVAFGALSPSERERLPDTFWCGALAIQMVHEASLLHDDILDGASHRRGLPTEVASKGVAAALVGGDHLLTAAYRVAFECGSPSFLARFCEAVEGTVGGELRQGRSMGFLLSMEEYRGIIRAKSGELFGAALVLAADVMGRDPAAAFEAGCRVGTLYQMVDDFLDLCPGAGLGKPPFQDYLHQKWTFPLAEAGVDGFGLSVEELGARLFSPEGSTPSAMRRALAALKREAACVEEALRGTFPEPGDAVAVIHEWVRRAAAAVDSEEHRWVASASSPASTRRGSGADARSTVMAEVAHLQGPDQWLRYFGQHGTSFRFASRLFPPGPRDVVAGVYAFCRFTDDLVDRREDRHAAEREALLDAWMELTREAFETGTSGVPLLDTVLGDAARAGVPFRYPEELVEGVRMDLAPRRFPDLPSLRVYSYRVASVVGLWLTERFGTRDPWVLARAEALGHAMQLTNILRDVGEDLRGGRIYLPTDRLEAHGIDPEVLSQAAMGKAPVPQGYAALTEELLAHAEADYREAFPAIAALPPFFQRPVAVAARVYEGIHREIRRNGYDNLRRRAFTNLPRKGMLAGAALLELRRVRRDHRARAVRAHPHPATPWLATGESGEAA
jgi:15-cis-phytoene synthase